MEKEDFDRIYKAVYDKVMAITGIHIEYDPECRNISTYRGSRTDFLTCNHRMLYFPRSDTFSEITDIFDIQ
jgi:hypothetical protein